MNLDVESSAMDDGAPYDASVLNTTREKTEQYLSAGILFPEEIRNAERILRHLKKMSDRFLCQFLSNGSIHVQI